MTEVKECIINYPSKWDDIVMVNCFKDGKFVKHYSNFNGDFNSSENGIDVFCETKANSGMYDVINVSCCDSN
jgi:hypothetical protein